MASKTMLPDDIDSNANQEHHSDDATDMTYSGKSSMTDLEIGEEISERVQAESCSDDAEKLFKRIEKKRAALWGEYMQLAELLGRLSVHAMHLSGANGRSGKGYSLEMSRLLERRAPKLGNKKYEVLRAALLNIHENREDVELWRRSWTESQQQTWISPITVWRQYKEARKPKDEAAPKAPSPMARASAAVIDLQDEVDRQAKIIAQQRREVEQANLMFDMNGSDEQLADAFAIYLGERFDGVFQAMEQRRAGSARRGRGRPAGVKNKPKVSAPPPVVRPKRDITHALVPAPRPAPPVIRPPKFDPSTEPQS